ncbi:retrovirus-related pol polyprotein from transposon TNT 1-94 [Tanacetum coccineum]
MEFLNKTLHAYFVKEGIRHETSTARTPKQNGVVERWNRTLVEAAQTMLSAAKVPLFFWAEAIATACFTQNRSLVLEQDSLSPDPQSQENVPQAAETVTTSNELDLLFILMFDELLNGSTQVVTKYFAIHAADAPDKRQHHNTTHSSTINVVADAPPLNIQTTPQTTNQAPTHEQTVTAIENIIQEKTNNEYAQVDDNEFVNVFSTPVQERGET